jgi:hypothetical protein
VLAHERERTANHLRVEAAGQTAVGGDRHDRHRLHGLATLEQR